MEIGGGKHARVHERLRSGTTQSSTGGLLHPFGDNPLVMLSAMAA
jgi:hypothetical protein